MSILFEENPKFYMFSWIQTTNFRELVKVEAYKHW